MKKTFLAVLLVVSSFVAGAHAQINITTQPQPVTTGTGQTATFGVVATGGSGTLTYQWQKDGFNLPGQTGPVLLLTNLQPKHAGFYSVNIKDAGSLKATSEQVALNINGVPFGLWQGLVAYYPFSGNATDATVFGNDGTPVNAAYTADRNGVANSALRLNGTNGYIKYPDSVFGPATPGFTWSFWVMPDTYTFGTWGMMYHGASSGEASAGWMGTTCNFALKFPIAGWKTATASCGAGLKHIICVYEKGARAELWIDGQLSDSIIPPNENLNVDPAYLSSSAIGAFRSPSSASNFYKGVMDEVRIYNRALSSTEVEQLFAGDDSTLVVQKNDLATGITGAKFVSTGVPAVNNSTHVAFQAVVTGTDAAATSAIGANTSGIWADNGAGTRQLVVRIGSDAPGTGISGSNMAVFSALSDPVYNNNNAVAFLGTLKAGVGDVVTTPTPENPVNNSIGIWSNDGGTLHLVARQGQQAPGLDDPDPVLFASFGQFVLPDQGGAIVLANLVGNGVFSTNNQGVWAVDTAGHLKFIVRKGDQFNGKTITALTLLTSVAAEGGQTRSYAQGTGDIVVKCTFSDSSWGVIRVVFP